MPQWPKRIPVIIVPGLIAYVLGLIGFGASTGLIIFSTGIAWFTFCYLLWPFGDQTVNLARALCMMIFLYLSVRLLGGWPIVERAVETESFLSLFWMAFVYVMVPMGIGASLASAVQRVERAQTRAAFGQSVQSDILP